MPFIHTYTQGPAPMYGAKGHHRKRRGAGNVSRRVWRISPFPSYFGGGYVLHLCPLAVVMQPATRLVRAPRREGGDLRVHRRPTPKPPNGSPAMVCAVLCCVGLFGVHCGLCGRGRTIVRLPARPASPIATRGGLWGRCRTVRARCAHGACTVRARFNVFGMVAQLVPR